MSDSNLPWGDAEAVQRGIDTQFRSLHAQAEEGKRTTGEIKAMAERAAADLAKLDTAIGELKNAQSMSAANQRLTGPESELRNFHERSATQGGDTVRLFAREVKFAGQNVGKAAGLLDCAETYGDWHARAKDLAEAMYVEAKLKSPNRSENVRDPATLKRLAPQALARLGAHLRSGPGVIGREAASIVERVFTDSNGAGGEFIPDQIVLPELDKALILSDYGLVTGNLGTMDLSGKNIRIPFLSTSPRPYKYGVASVDDPANYSSSTPGTTDRDITPAGMAIAIPMDRDSVDDSIVDVLPIMRQMIARAAALGREDAVINGDTAASHQDAIATWNPNSIFEGTGGGSGDHRRLYLGWRARAFDVGAASKLDTGTGLTYDEVLALAAKMSAAQSIAGDLALVVDYQSYLTKILAMTEVRTLDKYGPNASILGGEVGNVGPFRVMRTPVLAPDLANTGLYTGSGALATAVGVNLSRFKIARRRGLRVELDTEIRNGMLYLVATCRETLYDMDNGASVSSSSVRNAVVAYNI